VDGKAKPCHDERRSRWMKAKKLGGAAAPGDGVGPQRTARF
jgi:hypothetical protein